MNYYKTKVAYFFFRLIPLVTMMGIGCSTTSKTLQMNSINEDCVDVVELSYLVKYYLNQTDHTNFSLSDIKRIDTLGTVTNNFSRLEVANWPNVWRGGYAVYFKFADNRTKVSIKSTNPERISCKIKTKEKIGRNDAQIATKFDGEIHFHYPERHYHIAEIILRKHKN